MLSLFFIDRVANYAGDAPRIKNLFDECFNALKKSEPDFKQFDAEEVREAYFAKRTKIRKGGGEVEEFLDEVNEDSKEAKEAFELIMRKVEREREMGVDLDSPFAEITDEDIDNLFS